MVSDFLWFSLDTWGRSYPDTDEPQCTMNGDCMGNMDETYADKCCASLRLSEEFTDG